MRPIRFSTLSDIKLGLDDLTTKRSSALTSSATGKSYEPMLLKRRDAVNALPSALVGGKPLAVELGEMDGFHDGYGGAVWFVTEG